MWSRSKGGKVIKMTTKVTCLALMLYVIVVLPSILSSIYDEDYDSVNTGTGSASVAAYVEGWIPWPTYHEATRSYSGDVIPLTPLALTYGVRYSPTGYYFEETVTTEGNMIYRYYWSCWTEAWSNAAWSLESGGRIWGLSACAHISIQG